MTEFYDLKFQDENAYVESLIDDYQSFGLDEDRIAATASQFIVNLRSNKHQSKGFQSLMQGYDLTSEEGLALMTLAEALLRIPDAATANALINDKLSKADWDKLFGQAQDMAGKFSGYGLSLSKKVMDSMLGKVGMPFIRTACVQAMRLMGKTFVLGRDIDEALKEAEDALKKGYTHSFDMLGEGARTMADAEHYFQAYLNAIRAIGQKSQTNQNLKNLPLYQRPGISVKLSALYPRYEYAHKEYCVPQLTDRLAELCAVAMEYRLNLTVDAEECDRLGLSLQIIKNIIEMPAFQNWDGFGLAIQAYQKRAPAVIDKIVNWSIKANRKTCVRLVKGAYWDTEIKHAQVEGYIGFPVLTRKENTDLHYLVCAKKILDNRDVLTPLFGTHNAQTLSTLLEMIGPDKDGIMFQRLHGMGEPLYDQVIEAGLPVSIYAPVGTHKDLLAYLVRRLLENGANSSFVNKVYDDTPIEQLTVPPIDTVLAHGTDNHAHPKIAMPMNIFTARKNSIGIDLHGDKPTRPVLDAIENASGKTYDACSIVNGMDHKNGPSLENTSPTRTKDILGDVWYATQSDIQKAFEILKTGYPKWNATPALNRAAVLNKIADLYEENMNDMIGILVREAGKTIPDAVAEVREAVDFCRYYAVQGEKDFTVHTLEVPTGERNQLWLEGRGIFVCISPWNFPLAIFTGQVVAALMAGNAVVAKPAEQTPAIACYAVRLMLNAGVPGDAIALLQGDGTVGEKIINHKDIAGVAFTGSTQVAKIIHRTLADRDGAILPLIAETGGLNAMIVDSSALPEQVTDTAIHSAFGSAGQRCSALRILCVQEDVADTMIRMLKGAMQNLIVGNPAFLKTDVGPVIDSDALEGLIRHRTKLEGIAKDITYAPYDKRLEKDGHFFTPILAELDDLDMINEEAFGPIMHVVRYEEDDLENLIDRLNAKGYGLTFGLHTRIHNRYDEIAHLINAGNIYINRGQTGAVVGSQPFGGRGLSGTGPKAGGPYYLRAFACEKCVSNDITASGGNASLLNLS